MGGGIARGGGAGESQGPVEEIEVCALAEDVVMLGWGEVSRIVSPLVKPVRTSLTSREGGLQSPVFKEHAS